MKSVITAICLLLSFVILSVLVAYKGFSSGEDMAVQQETVTGKKPTSLTTLKHPEEPAENKPADVKSAETKPVVKTKPAETKPAEAKPAEVKPVAETKPDTETKPAEAKPAEGKLAPAAVPVVTAEEAENLNAAALEYSKTRMIVADHIKNGYKNVYSANFKRLFGVKLSEKQEQSLQEKGYDIHEFRNRLVPDSWTIDFSSVPSDIVFQKIDDGYNLFSPKDSLLFQAPRFDSMGSSFFMDAVVKNNSDEKECDIEVGVHSSGALNKGLNLFKKYTIAPGKETSIQWEISVYDHYSSFSPTISTKGNIVLKSFDVYRLNHDDITIVQGTIKERSVLPDPKSTDYPDCRYTARFIGESIINGKSCNKEIVLAIDGFKDKKVLPSNSIKENDKIKCAIIRFDSVPEDFSGIQEADDLNLFELDSYLVTSYERIPSFADYSETNLEIEFSDSLQEKKEYVSIFDKKINPSIPDDLKLAQKATIEQDLKRINEMLLPYTEDKKNEINSSFIAAWNEEKKKDPPNYNRIGKIVWRNMDNSFYSLPESFNIIQDYKLINQENLASLIAFKDYLESQGIQLIVSLVPDSYDISARVINRDFSNLPDFRTAYLVKQLLENGIEAIYSSDILVSKYNLYENPFYYPRDGHPGDLPQDVLSNILSERLSRFKFERQFERNDFKVVRTANTYMAPSLENRTFQSNCDIGNHKPGDPYTVNKIYYREQTIKNETNSPIIVLGNSYSVVPEPISRYLCMKTGIGIYHYSVSGIGVLSTAFQRIFNSPEKYLKDRKAFILALGTLHLLTNVPIPNLRDLDLGALVIQNQESIIDFEIKGGETKVPNFAVQLSNPSIFKTDRDGFCSILKDANIVVPSFDESKQHFLVFTYCCESNDKFELEVNDKSFPLSGNDQSYIWTKKVVPIPNGTHVINVSAHGRENSFFAVGGIQLYQQR